MKIRIDELLSGQESEEQAAVPPPSREPVKLSSDQNHAIDMALQGENLLITGPGGTGKSETVRHLIRELRNKHRYPGRVVVAASTGAAAVNINGCTIHAFLGTGISKDVNDMLRVRKIRTTERVARRLADVFTIIVDEVSMLSGDYISMLDYRLRSIRQEPDEKPAPFGGVQMIFVGDFTQLPPVPDRVPHKYPYAFESPAWRNADVEVVHLTEIFRQRDAEFIGHLMNVRYATLTPETVAYFNSRVGAKLDTPTRLYARNETVDRINAEKLAQLPGKAVKFEATFKGKEMYREKMFDARRPIVEPRIYLKEGAPVIFTRNTYEDCTGSDMRMLAPFIYANGEHGIVKRINNNGTVAVTKRTGGTVLVNPIEYEYRDGGSAIVARAYQLPLRLAWALTIHKAQGATLESVECDVAECFQEGHAYVALSRARTVEGLSLLRPLDPSRISANTDVIQYYKAVAEDADPYNDPFDPLNPPPTRCASCGTLLGRPGGMNGTSMCGPCETGEPETAYLFGDMW